MLEVSRILGTVAVSEVMFNKYGAINSIYQEIVRFSAQQNIAMVKAIMRSLSQQNQQAYKDIVKNLSEHFTEDELKDILPQ